MNGGGEGVREISREFFLRSFFLRGFFCEVFLPLSSYFPIPDLTMKRRLRQETDQEKRERRYHKRHNELTIFHNDVLPLKEGRQYHLSSSLTCRAAPESYYFKCDGRKVYIHNPTQLADYNANPALDPHLARNYYKRRTFPQEKRGLSKLQVQTHRALKKFIRFVPVPPPEENFFEEYFDVQADSFVFYPTPRNAPCFDYWTDLKAFNVRVRDVPFPTFIMEKLDKEQQDAMKGVIKQLDHCIKVRWLLSNPDTVSQLWWLPEELKFEVILPLLLEVF